MNPSPCATRKPANTAIKNILEYEKTPLEKRFPICDAYTLLQQANAAYAGKNALAQLYEADKNEKALYLTFNQFTKKITQYANLLHTLDVGRNDAVTILLPSTIENQIALWGSQAVGIANPINHFLDTDLIVEIMNEVGSKVLITLSAGDRIGISSKIPDIIKQVPTLTHVLLATDTKESTPDPAAYQPSMEDSTPCEVQILDMNRAMQAMPEDRLEKSQSIDKTATAIYFHTGGTTGKPKIAMLSHSSVTFVAQVYADYNHHHKNSVAPNPLPLFHVFGTIAASLAVFIQGRCVVMMTPTGFRNPNVVKNWWHFIEHFQVLWFPTVPTILNALLEIPVAPNNIDCLKYINSGSAPLSVTLKKTCAKKFNAEVVSGYGMTESSCLIARCLYGYETPEDTVGIRIPYTQLITAKLEKNAIVRVCEPGEPGVVLAKGPNIFKGYLNPEENASAWADEEWFNTGDIGVLDADGYLKLTGRAKDLIIRGGHNIDPLIIEIPLEKHPAVLQAVAVGQPDAYAGEIPVAYICLKKDQDIAEDELLDYCRQHIGERSAIPKRIEIITAMPLTAVGKISKPQLRNMATEYAVYHVLKMAGIDADLTAQNDPQKGQVVEITLFSREDIDKANSLLKGFPIVLEFKKTEEN